MARFAKMQSGRDYDFNPDYSRYRGASKSFGEAMGMGAVVPGLYDEAAKTGWNPTSTLVDSIGLRGAEKSEAIQAEARIRAAEDTRDTNIEIAKKQSKSASDIASKNRKNQMVSTGISTALTFGAALLSDESTKNSVENIENALKTLRELKPVTFYYNEEYSSNPERLHHGFIAQEYQKVMPDATYYDESIGKLCIDTSELIALLVRAIQQLEGRLTYLEAVNALEGAKA